MPRQGAKPDIPEHFESLPLGTGPQLMLWILAVLLAASTIALGLRTSSALSGPLGPLGGLVGVAAAAAGVAAWRLRRFEIDVTRAALRLGFGPFSRSYPTRGCRLGGTRDATGWRRFYSSREAIIEIDDPRGAFPVTVPVADVPGLNAALDPDQH